MEDNKIIDGNGTPPEPNNQATGGEEEVKTFTQEFHTTLNVYHRAP